MTKLKFINVFLLQWFFIRLTFCKSERHSWFSIRYFVLPLTGWRSDFIYLYKARLRKISTPKFRF